MKVYVCARVRKYHYLPHCPSNTYSTLEGKKIPHQSFNFEVGYVYVHSHQTILKV